MRTRVQGLCLWCLLLIPALALAETATTRPSRSPRRRARVVAPAATLPASAPATLPANLSDLLADAVDLYNPIAERSRLLGIAGPDGELAEAEFRAAVEKADSFVRRFDRWEALRAFDRNANGQIDWQEADAYRQGFRQFVLEAHDADRDGKLSGPERQAANLAMYEGRLYAGGPRPDQRLVNLPTRPAAAPAVAPPGMAVTPPPAYEPQEQALPSAPPAPAVQPGGEIARRETGQEQLDQRAEQFDADGDGQLSAEERRAMWAQRMGRLEERRQQRRLAEFDADGDGRLSEQELAAAQAREQDHRQQRQQQRSVQRYDRDRDGTLSERELLEADASGAQTEGFVQTGQRYLFDRNGDGTVSPDERELSLGEMHQSFMRLRQQAERVGDSDGDGQLSEAERQAMAERMQRRWNERLEGWQRQYDTNGNGQLDEQEREEMSGGIRREVESRFAGYDLDGNGRLDSLEQLRFMDGMAEDLFGSP